MTLEVYSPSSGFPFSYLLDLSVLLTNNFNFSINLRLVKKTASEWNWKTYVLDVASFVVSFVVFVDGLQIEIFVKLTGDTIFGAVVYCVT